jgi:serine/threonine protein kinase
VNTPSIHPVAGEAVLRSAAVPAFADQLSVPRDLHDWKIQGVCGRGTLGITYLAASPADGSLVAIREYFPADHAARDAGGAVRPRSGAAVARFRAGLERFVEEARGLSDLRHPGVVRGLRRFQENDTEYLVTEYVDGELLRTWLAGARPRTGAALSRFAVQLLDAVGTIHGAGLLHQAITPESIRVGPDGLPVLLDLGASRRARLDGSEDAASVAAAGYTPIELYGTAGPVGPWSDVYAVAAVLYMIVAGRRPIAAPARTSFDGMRRAQDAPDRDRYGIGLLRAIDWGLASDPAKRPQSIAAFREALLVEHPEFGTAVGSPVAAPAAPDRGFRPLRRFRHRATRRSISTPTRSSRSGRCSRAISVRLRPHSCSSWQDAPAISTRSSPNWARM